LLYSLIYPSGIIANLPPLTLTDLSPKLETIPNWPPPSVGLGFHILASSMLAFLLSIGYKNNITHNFSHLFGKQGKHFLSSLSLPEVYRMALDGYLSVLDESEQQIKVANERIVASAKDDEDARLLMTIPGVGYCSALLIKSEIGDINRFPKAVQLCSYAGLIPPPIPPKASLDPKPRKRRFEGEGGLIRNYAEG
jgi:hypothetical protein